MSDKPAPIKCPACGSNSVDHCDHTECTWWRCPNRNCNSYGYDTDRYVDGRPS